MPWGVRAVRGMVPRAEPGTASLNFFTFESPLRSSEQLTLVLSRKGGLKRAGRLEPLGRPKKLVAEALRLATEIGDSGGGYGGDAAADGDSNEENKSTAQRSSSW